MRNHNNLEDIKNIELKTDKQAYKDLLANRNNKGTAALFTARLLLDSGARKTMLMRDGYRSLSTSDLLETFAFKPLSDDFHGHSTKEFMPIMLPKVKQIYQELTAQNIHFSGALKANLHSLSKLLNLSKVEESLLGIISLNSTNKQLESITEALGDISRDELFGYLAIMLKEPKAQISAALHRDGNLISSGLFKIRTDNDEIFNKIYLLDGFADLINSENEDPLQLLSKYFFLSEPAKIQVANFPHLQAETQNVLDYLSQQMRKSAQGQKQQTTGINILVYGEPGTGKTQWIKALAKKLATPLYEISSENPDGDAVKPEYRVEMFKLAQHTLKNQAKSLIMFDEIEDIFPSSFMGFLGMGRKSTSKAWLNNLLENNPVPSFWITNSVEQIDPAYLRRFDLVVEMSVPPTKVRREILGGILAKLPLEESWIDELAKESKLVPALVERAAKVTKAMMPRSKNSEKLQEKLLSLINASLQVQGKPEIALTKAGSKLDYSLQFINTSANLEKLVGGLNQRKQGRILLYGLPGTGKTAFGHHLAEKLEKPLIIKRASDLLSPYVGVAEQNMARAFREAKQENAILQIDEADSFLQTRENAQRSWEVSQVNEMLTQMEAFDGIFIASTNLMDNLDSAAMRRFDVKLEFKPLAPNQAWLLDEKREQISANLYRLLKIKAEDLCQEQKIP